MILSKLSDKPDVMSNEQKQSKGLSVSAEVGQASSGDSGGNSAAVGQVFSMFKEFLEKKLVDKGKQIEQRSKLEKKKLYSSSSKGPKTIWN